MMAPEEDRHARVTELFAEVCELPTEEWRRVLYRSHAPQPRPRIVSMTLLGGDVVQVTSRRGDAAVADCLEMMPISTPSIRSCAACV